MATAISFDSTSLQTDNIHTREIQHESVDHRELNIQRLGNRDGGKFVEDTFAPRVIRLSGIIIGSTQSDLESRIDSLKQALNAKEKKLDVGYESGTRRYTATSSRVIITRDYFNVTFAPWEAEFTVSDPPFGTALDTLTIEYPAINFTIGTWQPSAVFSGTYRPLPIIQITINSQTAMTQANFTNTNTNQQIKVPRTYADGEVLTVDTQAFTVDVDGTAVDYEGVLPEFVQGANDLKVSFISTNHNITMKLIYYPLYI